MYLTCKSDSDLPTHITINKADATDNVCPSALESAQALLRMHLNCRSRGVNMRSVRSISNYKVRRHFAYVQQYLHHFTEDILNSMCKSVCRNKEIHLF